MSGSVFTGLFAFISKSRLVYVLEKRWKSHRLRRLLAYPARSERATYALVVL